MRRFSKIVLYFCLSAALIWGGVRVYFFLTDGFSLAQITPQAYQEQAKQNLFAAPDDEIQQVGHILQQPFHYLSKGSQSYAFLSEDGEYVLKFVKQKHLSPTYLEQFMFSLPGMETLKLKKENKYKKRWKVLVDSALLAEKKLKNETRLVYIHFQPTQNLLPEVQITDKLGFSYHIDADHYQFYLQKYILILRNALETWDDEKIKSGLSKVVDALLRRSEKGIQEDDCLILDNMGFDGLEPVFLDIGRLKYRDDLKDPEVYAAVLRHDVQPIVEFLNEHRPTLVPWFEAEISKKLQK